MSVRGAPLPPRYRSTRDATRSSVGFEAALERGLAPDGGLYVPTSIPRLADGRAAAGGWSDVVGDVLEPWFEPAVAGERIAAARAALDFEVPLRALGRDRYLLELFHGPTLAFKDVAARTMARWWSALLRRRGGQALVLVATSGDTGAAVADAFAGFEGMRVAVLYPAGGVSPLQEAQLTQGRPGTRAFAVAGSFDDCQRLVKEAMVDPALAHLGLTSANSINVGRLLPQMCSFAWAVLQHARLRGDGADPPLVCVPSGNLGHLTAGLMAAAMGVRVGGFVAAHNANDYFPRFLAKEADPFAYAPTVRTIANAMDVGAPSNFERLHALFPAGPPVPLTGLSISDEAALGRIAAVAAEDDVLVCPHTAIGLEAAERLRADGVADDVIVLATAHPAKFPEVVARAVPGAWPVHPTLEAARGARQDVVPLRADAVALARELERLAADQAPGAAR